eukprot:403377131
MRKTFNKRGLSQSQVKGSDSKSNNKNQSQSKILNSQKPIKRNSLDSSQENEIYSSSVEDTDEQQQFNISKVLQNGNHTQSIEEFEQELELEKPAINYQQILREVNKKAKQNFNKTQDFKKKLSVSPEQKDIKIQRDNQVMRSFDNRKLMALPLSTKGTYSCLTEKHYIFK